MPVSHQIFELLILALPIACVVRTLVFEEIFREPREYCKERSQKCRALLQRKFFYLFTCEYCTSHWVTLIVVICTRFHLLFDDWRGYVVGFLSLVFIANVYLNAYSRMRLEIQHVKTETKRKEKELDEPVE